jgi:carbon monoxide dehydrogenase subunit G
MASVKVTDRIEASADAVWGLLRDFGGIKKFSPAIESCSVEGKGIGAVRTITMPGGLALQERLEAFDDAGRSLQYAIIGENPLPFTDYLSTIRLSEDGGATSIEWSSTFEPKGIPAAQAGQLIEGIYTGGIAGLKSALAG